MINGLALEAYMGYKNAVTDAQAQLDSNLADVYMRGSSVWFPFYGSGLDTASISWPNNTERTFTVSRAFDGGERYYTSSVPSIGTINLAEPDRTGRLLQNDPALSAYTNTVIIYYDYISGKTQYNGNEEDFQGDITNGYSQNLIVFSHTWLPTASLSVKRCLANGSANDEGERLLVTAKLSKSEYADTSAMFCRLYYEENGTATTSSSYIDLTPSISALLAGVTDDASLVTQTFSNGSNWSFLLVFGDDYETASAPASIALAFANVHMSGASTGGVAFGRFSSSSEGNPKFECAYPATFESGLDMRVGGIDVTDQFTISKTAGKLTISSFKAYKCGPLIFFQLNCSMSGATTPGNSVFEGTIAGPWLPSFQLCGMSGFWATSIEVFFVDTTGKVTLRAMVANDGPSGSSSWSGVRSFYYFF